MSQCLDIDGLNRECPLCRTCKSAALPGIATSDLHALATLHRNHHRDVRPQFRYIINTSKMMGLLSISQVHKFSPQQMKTDLKYSSHLYRPLTHCQAWGRPTVGPGIKPNPAGF